MDTKQARINMLKQQLRTSYVLDQKILDLVAKTPREDFVPPAYKEFAFADMNIPLGHGQVMFSPQEEALVLQALNIHSQDVILEIGTGSGYMTALLARLGRLVYSLDIFPEFCATAQLNLAKHKVENVNVINADGALGWSEQMPYDVIVITGALEFLPHNFREFLRPGGRIFVIIGQAPAMEAVLLTYTQQGEWKQEKLFETVVPSLINAKEISPFVF